MSRAQFSMYLWSSYLVAASCLLLLAPTEFFRWAGLHDPGSGMWIRLSGMLLGIMGYFFFEAARSNNYEFMLWGAKARMLPIFFLTVFVSLNLESPLVLACGILDVLTGLWTLNALRLDSAERLAPE